MTPIWSSEINELEKLSESLKGHIPDLEKELGQLIKFDDPNVILLYARRCLEVIIIDLCETELKRPRRTEPLKGIIDRLHHEEKIPEHIIASMNGLNDLSTFGTHPKEFDLEQVRPALINLATVLKWYMRFKNIEISGIIHMEEPLAEETVHEQEIKPEKKTQIKHGEKVVHKKLARNLWLVSIVAIILIFGFFSISYLSKLKKRNWARYELLPQIQKLVYENFSYNMPGRAFELANEAEKYIPDDSSLIRLLPKISGISSLITQPEGARVYWKDYDNPDDPWQILGETPLKDIRVPLGYKRILIEKEGYDTVLITTLSLLGPGPERILKLDSIGVLPENMVRIPARIAGMDINGLEVHTGQPVGEFLADKFEVTNKEYKRFIDSGGYKNKNWWNFPIINKGKELSWESAMRIFIDKTGKPGPASWEIGQYPLGKENYPVSGISWYEAAAYAAFAGKSLPTVFHWSVLAETWRAMNIIPLSNFSGASTFPVGRMKGISTYGIYDLAGNVREWCYNGSGIKGDAYILGGGWNDPTYSFNDAYTQHCIDRSLSNGFRCIKELPGDTTLGYLRGDLIRAFRDYSKEKPVDDKTFNIFLRQYAYDKSPLNAQVTEIENSSVWKVEKVTMDAAYGDERFDVYLFLPNNTQPPYQPVIFLHGSNVIFSDHLKTSDINYLEFLVQSGRAIVFPVLKGTYERRDGLNSDYSAETVFYKDHLIMWRKDVGRAIDYIETRDDILSDKLGYFGWSWGGFLGGIIPAVETRIKAVVLNVGGMEMTKTFPEADQINFLPRITQPVLMLNGKYDMYFPVETAQKPMYNFLGTPVEDKKILVYDTGHLVPRIEIIKQTLAWYDKYLGPVK
jgi:dienelactone hydrolase